MTTTPTHSPARRLDHSLVPRLVTLLQRDFGEEDTLHARLANQHLLDALDRGDCARFAVWPGHEPLGVIHVGANGTLVVAGDPAAGPSLAEHAEAGGWRVLIGDLPIATALLQAGARGLFRRRPTAREQRFMVRTPEEPADVPAPVGLRRARAEDLGAVTELACRLHVEDRMGPPISRAGRAAVRSRMRDSIRRGATWVVERDGEIIGKVDESLHSHRRGGQIAGVYVDAAWRGQGIATAAVAAVARGMIAEGLPGVTLHVRADNEPAQAAYRRAGFRDRGAWLLALR